jgi:hypothetical protein
MQQISPRSVLSMFIGALRGATARGNPSDLTATSGQPQGPRTSSQATPCPYAGLERATARAPHLLPGRPLPLRWPRTGNRKGPAPPPRPPLAPTLASKGQPQGPRTSSQAAPCPYAGLERATSRAPHLLPGRPLPLRWPGTLNEGGRNGQLIEPDLLVMRILTIVNLTGEIAKKMFALCRTFAL